MPRAKSAILSLAFYKTSFIIRRAELPRKNKVQYLSACRSRQSRLIDPMLQRSNTIMDLKQAHDTNKQCKTHDTSAIVLHQSHCVITPKSYEILRVCHSLTQVESVDMICAEIHRMCEDAMTSKTSDYETLQFRMTSQCSLPPHILSVSPPGNVE